MKNFSIFEEIVTNIYNCTLKFSNNHFFIYRFKIANKPCLLYFTLVDNKVLDFSVISERCGVDKDTPQNVINNIANLEEFYDDNELVEIYNYFLTNVNNPEILTGVIKLADTHKASSTDIRK